MTLSLVPLRKGRGNAFERLNPKPKRFALKKLDDIKPPVPQAGFRKLNDTIFDRNFSGHGSPELTPKTKR